MAKEESTTYGKIPSKLWDKGEQFIVKLQVPLGGDQTALLYDKTGKWQIHIPLSWTKELDMEGKFKKYFYMHFNKAHQIEFDDDAEDQDW